MRLQSVGTKTGFRKEALMEKVKKILAPTDLSELSRVGVRHALNLAKAMGAEVTVYLVVGYDELMHYGDDMSDNYRYEPPDHILERYRHALDRFLMDHFSDLIPGIKVHEKVALGAPDRNIVDEAKADGSDLIVLSTHGRTGLSHVLLGSVTEKVVRHAACPVLSVRPPKIATLSMAAA
jgi:nucleotide-binding universal stress UspA family protein